MVFVSELTDDDKARVRRIRSAGLAVIRARGSHVVRDTGRRAFEITWHKFFICHSTPFNPSLIKTDIEEREYWRRFDFRLLISLPMRSCVDVYWNSEGLIECRSFRREDKYAWDKRFLNYARREGFVADEISDLLEQIR